MAAKVKHNGRKLLAALMSAVLVCTSMLLMGASKAAAQSNSLPANCIIGYWENWVNGPMLKLSEVDPNWDVIIVSFMLTDSSNVRAVFTPDNTLYPGGDSAFIEDVKFCQNRGQKVLISLGGATGNLQMNSDSERSTFYDAACQIIEKYGFDGIDIDLEHSILSVQAGDTLTTTVTPIQGHLNKVLHDMVNKFGSDFMVTMAPEHPYVQGGAVAWRGFYGGYMPLINNCRDILTFIHPQYYNNPINEYNGQYWGCPTFGCDGYNVNSLVVLSKLLITGFETKVGFFEGLRPDQVAFGVPATKGSAGSGYLPISDYQQALSQLIAQYPTFRGIMTWSINQDRTKEFVNGMRQVIGEKEVAEPLTLSVSSNQGSSVQQGTNVTWTASAAGGKGGYSYKFELYKNNALISTQQYSSNSTFMQNLSSTGEYYVIASVKDSSGNTQTKTSSSISVTGGGSTTGSTVITMKLATPYVVKDGQKIASLPNPQGCIPMPLLVMGGTVLPMRFVCETLGFEVGYDDATGNSSVIDKSTNTTITLYTGTNIMYVNKNGFTTTVQATAPTILIKNTTHIAVRTLLEQLGYKVAWYESNGSGYVIVSKSDQSANYATLVSAFERA